MTKEINEVINEMEQELDQKIAEAKAEAQVAETTTETLATEEVKSSATKTTKASGTKKPATTKKTSGKKPVEKSAKTLKGAKPAPAETTEEATTVEEAPKATAKSSAKSTKTSGTKKAEDKKPVEAKYLFPKELVLKGIGKIRLVPDDLVKDFDSFAKVFENLEEASVKYVMAFYTPKSALKNYDPSGVCKAPKSFENDLDILQVRDIDPEIKRVHIKSVYTMVYDNILEDDKENSFELQEYINKYHTSESFRLNGSYGWQMYEIIEPAPEDEEEEAEE